MYRIGIDVGGTFTDFTLLAEVDGTVGFHKVASTPHDPSEAIERGIADLLREHRIAPRIPRTRRDGPGKRVQRPIVTQPVLSAEDG